MAARGVNITARNGAASSWTALRTSEPPPLRDVVLCRPQSRLFCPPSHPRISESQSSITNNRGAASFLSAWNHLQIDDVLTDLVDVVAAGPLLTRRRDCRTQRGALKTDERNTSGSCWVIQRKFGLIPIKSNREYQQKQVSLNPLITPESCTGQKHMRNELMSRQGKQHRAHAV